MPNIKFYGLLVGLSIMIMMACDTLAFKVVHIFSHDFAASGIIFSLNFLVSSVITEVYGFNLAGRIIWVQLICHIFFVILVNIFVLLPSPDNSTTNNLYFSLYKNICYILCGSCVAMPTAYFINDIIVSKLKLNLYGKLFIFRFLISNVTSSAVLVSISYPVNFYNQFPIKHIAIIAINTWIYKIFIALLLLPLASFLATQLKKIEETDYYDFGISYNPLNVFSKLQLGENRYVK